MKKFKPLQIILIIAGAFLIAGITYFTALSQTLSEYSDYYFHANWSAVISFHHLETFFQTYQVFYPIWHFVVFFFYRVGIPIPEAAAITTMLINVALYLVVSYSFYQRVNFRGYRAAVGAAVLLLVQPIWAGIKYALVIGHFSPNEWRNPTTLATRLFGVITFVLLVRILECKNEKTKQLYILFLIALSLSVLAKPSFIQMFVPGVGIYMLCELITSGNKKELLVRDIKIAVVCIPAVLIMFFQMFQTFGGQDGIGVSWLEYWGTHTDSMIISMLLAFAFPLYVVILDYKRLKCMASVKLAWTLQFAGWLEGAILIETGSRRMHGNFVWANSLAMFLVFAVMLQEFIFYSANSRKGWRDKGIWTGAALLFLHLTSGIWWLTQYVM